MSKIWESRWWIAHCSFWDLENLKDESDIGKITI